MQRVSNPVNIDENKLYYQIGIRSHSKGIFYKKAETGKQIGNKKIFWIESNCLILNIVFAWEQAIAKTSQKEIGRVASHRFPMYKVLNNSLDYIIDFFKTEKGRQVLQMASPGGAGRNKTLNQKFFLSSKVYLPSLKEQLIISRFITLIENRIETQIKIIENLYSQRKCIFLQLNNNYHHNKIKINELGPVSIANNLSKDDLVDDGRKCILYGELFTKYDLYTTHAISKTNKTYHIITSSGNDLLFPTSTTVNALSLIKPLALCQKDIILGGDMFSIKLNDTYNAIYISCLINYVYKKQLASKTQGTTIVHLYYENIKNEIIEICDYEIQCKIAEYIKFITSKIETEKELLNKLHLQKAFLLRNLFI